MKMTKRLQQFVRDVALAATSDSDAVTLDGCVSEYTDQIETDDYDCVVSYAEYKGIKIPQALMGN